MAWLQEYDLTGFIFFGWASSMEWLATNKEWLFSGIAIALPLAVIGWFISSKKIKQSQKSGNNSVNIQVAGDLKLGGHKDAE